MEIGEQPSSTEINNDVTVESAQKKLNVTLDEIVPPSAEIQYNGMNGSAEGENGHSNEPITAVNSDVVEIAPVSLDDVVPSTESTVAPEIVSVEEKASVVEQSDEVATPYTAAPVEPMPRATVMAAEPVASIAVNPDIGVNVPGVAVNPDIGVHVPGIAVHPEIAAPPVTKPPSGALPDFVFKSLEGIAVDKGYQNFTINITKGSKHADGFVGEIYKATVSDGKTDNKSVLIVKVPPENEIRRKMMGMRLFEREVIVYNKVLPVFEEFQRSKGLKVDRGFFGYPRCYYAYFDAAKDESAIIMDDIRLFDFSMENMFRTTKYEHAKSIMIHLGRLHGVSLAMKEQCPEKFEQFKQLNDNFTETFEEQSMQSLITYNVNRAISILNDDETKIKQKLQSYADNMVAEIKRLSDPELSEPYTVLIHGDCHINNMMFRYESGIPKYICLYDWQLLRYAAPAIDIAYFIFMCTDKPLRDQHFDHLIQAYHNSLREQLERLGSDVNQLFPFTALIRQLKTFTRFILGTVLFAIPMLCMEREDIPEMDVLAEQMASTKPELTDEIMFKLNQKSEVAYKERMGGILRDMARKGYL